MEAKLAHRSSFGECSFPQIRLSDLIFHMNITGIAGLN